MTIEKQFILDTLFRLTACSGEDAIFEEIFAQIRKFDKSASLSYAGNERIGKYLVYRRNSRTSVKYLFLVHADRLEFEERRMEFYRDSTSGQWFLRGQLDNIISIAIILYLIRSGYPIDCLFTTREEQMRSHPQIIEYLQTHDKKDRYRMIDLDIDVADNEPRKVLENGYITLPYTSHNLMLSRQMIDDIETFANSMDIPVTRFNRVALAQAGSYLQTDSSNRNIIYMGLPLLAYHSPTEAMSWNTVKNALNLLCNFLQHELVSQHCQPVSA